MNKKGFTLIELLVVIAIIGILSSVVLASLNSARSKGQDARTKAQLANMRADSEIFYDDQNPGTYSGVCTHLGFPGSNLFTNLTNADCDDSAGTVWSASAELSDTSHWCVDSNGTVGEGMAAAAGCATP